MDFADPSSRPLAKQRVAGIAAVVMFHLALVALLLQLRMQPVPPPERPPFQLEILKPPPREVIEMPPVEARLLPPAMASLPTPKIVIAEPEKAKPIAPPVPVVAPPVPPLPVAVAAPVARPAPPAVNPVPAGSGASAPGPNPFPGVTIGDIGTAGMVRAKMDMDVSPKNCHDLEFPTAEDPEAYGLAAVSLLIGPDGAVRQTRIDTSSGHPLLDQATLDSFSRCKYIRGTIGGRPAPTWYRIKWLWFMPRAQRIKVEAERAAKPPGPPVAPLTEAIIRSANGSQK